MQAALCGTQCLASSYLCVKSFKRVVVLAAQPCMLCTKPQHVAMMIGSHQMPSVLACGRKAYSHAWFHQNHMKPGTIVDVLRLHPALYAAARLTADGVQP